MTIYKAKLTFDTIRFEGDFAQAASPIWSLPSDPANDDTESSSTPFQVADARHDPHRAAKLLLEYYGRNYWCDHDSVKEDDEGNETFDGMSKDDYLESLIISVEAEEEKEP